MKELKLDYKKAFDAFDMNKDKKIDKKELQNAFKKMNLQYSNEDINEIFAFIDQTNDQTVELDEFIRALNL